MKKYLLLSLIAVLTVLSYLYFSGKKTPTNGLNEKAPPVKPGTEVAVLTLADGSQIILDSAGGQIPKEPLNTTVATPRGGQYRLTLADGTKILLNAATSVKFPIDYGKKERKIELVGEAYFEVTKSNIPFKVLANGTEIASLGTVFNVMAYPDEMIMKTTLVDGSIRVSKKKMSQTMKAGQQAIVKGDAIRIIDVDLKDAVGWRNGVFEKGDAYYLLRQMSKWYDVDVIYDGIKNIEFDGSPDKGDNLENLLELLQAAGLNVALEKNRNRRVLKAGK